MKTSLVCSVLTALTLPVVSGAIVEHIGSGFDWDVTWQAVPALNDGRDAGIWQSSDFVGDASDPGAFWADTGDYFLFRFRVDHEGAVGSGTFSGAHLVLIDLVGQGTANLPDYSFSWDSKSADPDKHGLEMGVLATSGSIWSGVSMDDLDGSNGQKLVNDINGDGRSTDGYLRTVDGQTTTNFGSTTFVDIAVSWSYLETYTDLAKGQTWNIALGSVENATDHNLLTADIAGGASPSSSITTGWALAPVPEPDAWIAGGLLIGMGLFGTRRRAA